VSGEPVFLQASADSIFARAFGELSAVPPGSVQWALVGGIAVGARLALAHRATHDVDAVSPRPDELVELLVEAGGVKSHGMVKLHGVLIEPLPIPGEGAGQLPTARQWAFDTATELHIVVRDPAGARLADASPRVAGAAGLVLLKLESAVHAFDRSAAKRATDVYDVLRLYAVGSYWVTAAVAGAPRALRADAAQCARDRLLANPAATLRHLSDGQAAEFGVDEMRFYGESLVAALSS
jgi:hypothetical protein